MQIQNKLKHLNTIRLTSNKKPTSLIKNKRCFFDTSHERIHEIFHVTHEKNVSNYTHRMKNVGYYFVSNVSLLKKNTFNMF